MRKPAIQAAKLASAQTIRHYKRGLDIPQREEFPKGVEFEDKLHGVASGRVPWRLCMGFNCFHDIPTRAKNTEYGGWSQGASYFSQEIAVYSFILYFFLNTHASIRLRI